MGQARKTKDKSSSPENSLIKAIKSRNESVAMLLMLTHEPATLDIDKQGSKRDGSALFWAACRGFFDLVGLLLVLGADVTGQTIWGGTPLHAAADNGRIDVARLLLEQGASPHTQTAQGDTPCHLAAFSGHLDMVKLLVNSGADIFVRNKRGQNVIGVAQLQGSRRITNWLTRRDQEDGLLYEEVLRLEAHKFHPKLPGPDFNDTSEKRNPIR